MRPAAARKHRSRRLPISVDDFEFGKRTGLVRERKAQVAEAEENLHHTENQVRIDIEKELRKLNRTSDELDAARRSVKDRTEMLRIVEDQVHSSTANVSALRDAEAQLADARHSFDAENGPGACPSGTRPYRRPPVNAVLQFVLRQATPFSLLCSLRTR